MTDWKPEKNISSPWDANVWENNIGQPVKPSADNLPYPYTTMTIHQPEVICEFDMFGQKQLVISFHRSNSFPIPNRWIRFWTKVFFNSKWDFKKDT
jgi:hypothetical protein